MSDDFLQVPTREQMDKAYADHAAAHPGILSPAMDLIENMAIDFCTCQIKPICSTRTRRRKPRRRKTIMSCDFCKIYTIAHGAGGCLAKDCSVCARGVKEIKEYCASVRYT